MIFLTGTAPPGETEPQRRARVLLELEERQRQLAVEIAEQTLKTATSGAKAARADASMKTAAAKVQRETDQRRDADVERNPIPDSLILTNMPVTYSAAQLRAGLMGFLAPTLDDQGNPLLICDLSTTSPHAKGAVSMLARGVKNLLNRCREQEVKLAGPLFPGTEKSGVVPMREVTVDDVAGVILTLMYNTTVNISKFKHRFIGFNPDEDRSRFFQVFNQEGLTAEVDGVIKSMVEKKLKPPQPGKPIKPLEGYSAAVDAELTLTIGVELGLTGADATDPSKIQAKWASMDVAARDEFMKGKPKKGRTAAVPKLSVRLRKLAVLPPEPDAGTELTPAYLEQCEQARSMQGVFSEAEAVIKITPIEGVLHRPKNREKAMGKSLGEVTVADAMAFALWDHETGGHSSEAINTEVALAIKKKLSEMFTYVSFDGGDGKIRDAITALERDGVVFNRHLTELFGWMARDTALRVHDRYLAITKRLPPKRRALRNAYVIGAEAPDAQAKAHAQIDIYHDAHRVTLEEFRDRPDLTVYEADMVMAAHKGWDDMFIQKESIFGIGNPQWKFDFCRQACEEFFLDLRDHEDVRPNFQKETENQRRIANKMWARYNNEIVCDAQGNPVNGARIKRDADSQDIIVEGIGTLNTSTYGYVKRTWGDDKSGLNNVRGYNYTINTVWDCRQVSDLVGEGHRLLLAVNQGREQRIRHVDEISAADLTDDVIARFNNGYLPGFLPGLTPTAIYVRGERQLRTMALAQSRTADGVITHEFNEHIRTNATSIIDAEATSQLTDEGVAINPSNISARVNQLTQQARTHGLDNVGFARSIYIRDTINGEAREQLLLEHHVADQQSISQRARDLTKKAADQNMNEEMLAKAIYRDHRVRELGRSSEIVVTEAQAAEDLAKRVARTRLEHDIKRGTYIYMFTLFVKSRIMHSPDVELRHRCVFRNGMADPTAYEMLDNELYQLSRMPPNAELAQDDPRRLIVDGREATDEEQARIRKYAFALYKFPADAVHRIFYATDWRKVSSPDAADNVSWRKLVFNDMLMSNFTPEQRDLMSSLVDESEVDGETLYQTMVNLGRCFETRHDSMLRDGIDASNKYEHLPSPTGDIFAYDRVFVTEALKNSAPPGTPESPDERGRCEDYYGRVRLARLFGKYGNRLKNLRDMLGNPYAPVGYSIAFGPETEAEREQLLAELSQDIFGQGEFGRIGAAMKEKAFQDYCKSQGLDIKPEDGKAEASRKRGVQAEVRAKSDKGATWKFGQESSRSAALQLYIFMQAVHAKYRGQGEQITNANEFGVKGLEPQKVTFDVLLEAMTNVTTETNDDNAVHLRVRQFSQDEADRLIVCPRSRNPYPLTIVHRGVAVEGCSWANIQRAVSVLSENPYTREYTLNIARNQGAYRAFHDLTRQGQLRAGDVAINTRIRDMLTQQEVDTHHRVFAELDMADAAGTAVNLDVAERTLHDIQNNALRSTAHYLGIGNPDEVNLEDLGEFFKEFCNGVLQANQGRYANYVEDGKTKKGAVTALSSAYTYAKRFQYTGEGVDLRVITLNTRGWVKAEAAKQIPLATNRELRASYQGSLDDFTAAWHTSRGESPDLALNPARWVIGKPIQWFRDRFANIRRERVEGENAEAMAGMGVMNANITNVSRAAGEEIRKWMLRTAAWSVPAAPFTAGISLIPGAVAIGLVVATERLHISNDWTERAMEEFNNNPQPAHMDYLGDYLDRTIRYSRAQTLVNHGDHSWFRFLRQFWGTFRMDYRAMDRYEHAASILDPLTHDHVLHASSSTVSDRQQHPEVMQDLYFDTFSSRLLKRTALEACGRYYPAAWGTLNTNTFPTTAMPPVEQNACAYRRLNPDEYEFGRLYELAHRNNNLDRGWLRTVCDSTGLNYIGKRVAVSDMLKYVSNHPDPGEPRSVGVNNRAAILLKTIAATETNPHLIAGYMERAREQWAIARDKWAAILQRDLILVHAEAERDLLINGQAYLHDSPPPRMHR